MFSNLARLLAVARSKEEGQTMAEYAVVLALITVAIVLALAALSGGIATAIGNVVTVL